MAMAVVVQENIDVAKKIPNWTPPWFASKVSNWVVGDDGVYHLKPHDGVPADWIEPNGQLSQKSMEKWVKSHFPKAQNQWGNMAPVKTEEILPWRASRDEGKKSIDPSTWSPRTSQYAATLVDHCHNSAQSCWAEWREKNVRPSEDKLDLVGVMRHAMAQHNVDLPQALDWHEYRNGLRVMSGLGEYGATLRRIMMEIKDPEERAGMIQMAQIELEGKLSMLTPGELLQIWVTELDVNEEEPDYGKRMNAAFRAVAFRGSPIMAMLGLKDVEPCSYFDHGRLEKAVKWLHGQVESGQHPDIFVALQHSLDTNTGHLNDKGVHLTSCEVCRKKLEGEIIGGERKKRQPVCDQILTPHVQALKKGLW
jgi:hypothetical protein